MELAERWLAADAGLLAQRVVSREFDEVPQIAVVLVSDDEMHRLNRDFRATDRPTDVLSFDLSDEGDQGLSGEVYVGLDQAAVQAQAWGTSPEAELARLMVHGLLHLAGYDHQTDEEAAKMEGCVAAYLSEPQQDSTPPSVPPHWST